MNINLNSGYKKYLSQAIFLGIIALLFIFPAINNLAYLNSGSGEKTVSSAYTITAYDSQMVLSKDNVLSVTETIDVNFTQFRRGIFRAIPILQQVTFKDANNQIVSKNYKTEITNVTASEAAYTYEEEGIFYIRLGEEDVVLPLGAHSYEITYDIALGDDRYTEFDQFYYNVLGTSWDTSVSNFSFTLTLPEAVDTSEELEVFYGVQGSDTTLAPIPVQADGMTFTHTFAQTFNAYEGVTTRIVLDEGYFNFSRDFSGDILISLLIVVLIVGGMFVYNKYQNRKVLTPVVNFEVPKGMPPSEAGFIIDGIVDNKDIAALIVYWAQKGCLKIVDTSKSAKKSKLSLSKVKDLPKKSKQYEKDIFNKIFSSEDTIKLKDIGEKIYFQVESAKSEIVKTHEGDNFNKKTIIARSAMVFAATLLLAVVTLKVTRISVDIIGHLIGTSIVMLVALCAATITLKTDNKQTKKQGLPIIMLWLLIIAGLAAFAYFTFDAYADPFFLSFISLPVSLFLYALASKVNIRTNEGMENLGQLLGFKQFILLTEKDKIEMLAKDNPEMFYNVLPYAYVLGVADDWIDKFEGIAIDPPKWYSSNHMTVFDYMIMRSMFRNMMTSSLSSVSYRPKSSTISTSGGGFSGGFGGGGFSGGGFGGGGGGSW